MKTLVFLEFENGEIKKSALEAISFGRQLSGGAVTAVAAVKAGTDFSGLGAYGVEKVLHISDAEFDMPEAQPLASALAQAVDSTGAEVVVLPKTSLTDATAPRLAAKINASVASNVIGVVSTGSDFVVKRGVFTGKAFANTRLEGGKKVLTLKKNSVDPTEGAATTTQVEAFSPSISAADHAVKRLSVEKATGEVLLPEADIVVSGGRGMKGPENWGLIEDLAHALGAATGCSKPVSDMDWRPHHEHVGQTGIKVSPNLYIAVGISGAIQHVAGINSSKVIVAINKDPEAPIFKVADYGIVGDAFEVLPKLTAAVKNLN